MNFLAHLLLAGKSDASRIGNLLGDFVKGTPRSLEGQYPPEVIAGIVMHRHLDRFTDQHHSFLEARALLSPERRRFAGIIVDIYFDHFLSVHWESFGESSLSEFIDEIYDTFERHPEWLHEDLAVILPRMRRENWLHSYLTLDGLALTFQRVARRSPRTGPISEATDDLSSHYEAFEHAFCNFFPDARSYAAELLNSGASGS